MSRSIDKQAVRRMLEMQESGLLTWRHLRPWAMEQVEALQKPPAWMCELVAQTSKHDISRCLRTEVHAPPFATFDEQMLSDYAIACLLLRHERRELSWASFLLLAGELADCRDVGREPCEFYFAMLEQLEACEFDRRVERRQRPEVAARLADVAGRVKVDFAPFLAAFRRSAGR